MDLWGLLWSSEALFYVLTVRCSCEYYHYSLIMFYTFSCICDILLSFFKLVKTLEVGKIAIVQNNNKGKREIIKISK